MSVAGDVGPRDGQRGRDRRRGENPIVTVESGPPLPGEQMPDMRKAGGVEFTGERYIPQLDEAEISFEHWHRYLWVEPFIAGKAILDIACGEGYGAALLARSAAHVTGVDSDGDTLDHARATYAQPNLDFICGSAQEIPLVGTHLFDVVVSFETIEHLGEEDQRYFLAEIKRVLKPDGIAVFSTPNRTIYSDKPRYRNPFHIKEFTGRSSRRSSGKHSGMWRCLASASTQAPICGRFRSSRRAYENINSTMPKGNIRRLRRTREKRSISSPFVPIARSTRRAPHSCSTPPIN